MNHTYPDDRGSVFLNTLILMAVMSVMAFAFAKTFSPALHVISAKEDVKQAGDLTALASTYVNQTGDNQPTIGKLILKGFLPTTARGVCGSCAGGAGSVTTNDGSVIAFLPGSSQGIYQVSFTPGPNMNQDIPYFLSHLTGSVSNGNQILWNQPIPAIANLSGQYVQKYPTGNQPQPVTGSLNIDATNQNGPIGAWQQVQTGWQVARTYNSTQTSPNSYCTTYGSYQYCYQVTGGPYSQTYRCGRSYCRRTYYTDTVTEYTPTYTYNPIYEPQGALNLTPDTTTNGGQVWDSQTNQWVPTCPNTQTFGMATGGGSGMSYNYCFTGIYVNGTPIFNVLFAG